LVVGVNGDISTSIRREQANGAGYVKLDYREHAMNELRKQLHQLVDQLPDRTLEHAKTALIYCGNQEKHSMTIENAKRRAKENSERSLRAYAERTGHSFISGIGSGGGQTFADGNHHSSMIAFEDGKDATYHLYMYRGTVFGSSKRLRLLKTVTDLFDVNEL
jgi:hypothetical protein